MKRNSKPIKAVLGAAILGSILTIGACATTPKTPDTPEVIAQKAAIIADLETRPEAHIAFENQLDNFRVTYEDHKDILYLDNGFGKWYRGPLTCFGRGDPQSAMSLATINHGTGIDKFTRFYLLGGGGRNECFVSSLKELKPQETVVFGLETQKHVDAREARKNK